MDIHIFLLKYNNYFDLMCSGLRQVTNEVNVTDEDVALT